MTSRHQDFAHGRPWIYPRNGTALTALQSVGQESEFNSQSSEQRVCACVVRAKNGAHLDLKMERVYQELLTAEDSNNFYNYCCTTVRTRQQEF
eukprot:TRINITY_DN19742_c0_g2_i4.p2 TRINITY_DN19742_c0_g2~~TRINITY_DN19742_c0_g2_i4.p2  ORF type:complete len:109 (+),score=0.58 TRINITY_DN19742_c0_g2_i4:51-329(+)